MLASAPQPAINLALDTPLALALPAVRNAYAYLAAGTDTSVVPLLQPILSTGFTPSGARLHGSDLALRGRDEDPSPATSHTQSLLAEQFFVASEVQNLYGAEPSVASRLCPFLQCFQICGTSNWLLAVPISGIQQTLEGQYFRIAVLVVYADVPSRCLMFELSFLDGHLWRPRSPLLW